MMMMVVVAVVKVKTKFGIRNVQIPNWKPCPGPFRAASQSCQANSYPIQFASCHVDPEASLCRHGTDKYPFNLSQPSSSFSHFAKLTLIYKIFARPSILAKNPAPTLKMSKEKGGRVKAISASLAGSSITKPVCLLFSFCDLIKCEDGQGIKVIISHWHEPAKLCKSALFGLLESESELSNPTYVELPLWATSIAKGRYLN